MASNCSSGKSSQRSIKSEAHQHKYESFKVPNKKKSKFAVEIVSLKHNTDKKKSHKLGENGFYPGSPMVTQSKANLGSVLQSSYCPPEKFLKSRIEEQALTFAKKEAKIFSQEVPLTTGMGDSEQSSFIRKHS